MEELEMLGSKDLKAKKEMLVSREYKERLARMV